MASNTSNPLVTVDFVNESNYITVSDGSDIVGVVADTNWGPVGVPTVCNSSTYRTLFNPQGLGRLNSSQATIQRLFDMGASYVEVVRLGTKGASSTTTSSHSSKALNALADDADDAADVPVKAVEANAESWIFFTVSGSGSSLSLNIVDSITYDTDTECLDFGSLTDIRSSNVAFRLRYPGGFPMRATLSAGKQFMGKTLFTFTLSAYTGQEYSTDADGAVTSDRSYNSVLETLSFTLEPLEANGVSYFYADQIANNSFYLTSDVAWAIEAGGIEGASGVADNGSSVDVATYDIQSESQEGKLAPTYTADNYKQAYGLFKDRDISTSTLLVNSFIFDDDSTSDYSGVTSVLKAMSEVSETRKDCNSLLGFPTSNASKWWGPKGTLGSTVKNSAVTWFKSVGNSGLNMFSSGIVGWETVTLRTTLGIKKFNLDCTAAWAGRICATAYALHNRNQLPSYKAYGSFSGSLVRTLDFETVVAMHDDDGIGSVYSSAVGNYIFCIRDLYGAGESYFARLNVMRVTAALLSQTFDMVEEVIHTDVAANRSNRLALEGRLNTLLGNFAARQELKVESYANVGDELNSDVNTNGGRYLRIQLVCYFMSLTEKVFITVVARDGSVSADISMAA